MRGDEVLSRGDLNGVRDEPDPDDREASPRRATSAWAPRDSTRNLRKSPMRTCRSACWASSELRVSVSALPTVSRRFPFLHGDETGIGPAQALSFQSQPHADRRHTALSARLASSERAGRPSCGHAQPKPGGATPETSSTSSRQPLSMSDGSLVRALVLGTSVTHFLERHMIGRAAHHYGHSTTSQAISA